MDHRRNRSSRWSPLLVTLAGLAMLAMLAMLAAMMGMVSATPSALAQGTTPVASPAMALGEPVPPEACTVERRTLESMPSPAMATPDPIASASPATFTLPEGTVASPEVVSAVTETLLQSIACGNAGDSLRQFAILSDNYIATLLVQGGVPTLGQTIYDFLATPVPNPPEAWIRVDAIEDVQVLLDGRVGAVVTTTGAETRRSFVVFVERDGVYLIDRLTPIPAEDATPAA